MKCFFRERAPVSVAVRKAGQVVSLSEHSYVKEQWLPFPKMETKELQVVFSAFTKQIHEDKFEESHKLNKRWIREDEFYTNHSRFCCLQKGVQIQILSWLIEFYRMVNSLQKFISLSRK